MRTPLVAGNWKLNKTESEAIELINAMMPGLEKVGGVEKLICPPFIALSSAARLLNASSIKLGAQNMFYETEGAYTGEISPTMLKDLCEYVILGHSERREYFGESNQIVNKKIKAALAHDLIPILCVGENLADNEAGKAADVISTQLRASLVGANIFDGSKLVVAYEPIWAIGTGRSATAEGANRVIRNVVRPILSGIYGAHVGNKIRILYGGSVKANNAKEYFGMSDIDGALVGGASLKAEEFVGIAEAAQK
ncbi:MAG: triose-phosphate isomerase [Chloroflexi bacterium]|mgnify:CR=1 FL=1|jgi:triosephosphate isomerase (TIM)|nr:triose-phosphate isomerase [Chloroflexota bacterium]MBT3669982.1 triose-phosphate isomerase [Chloroflexota bacterium]MBT4003001.1 triose-phosphate isomerase [Chloroflexota bacterium]MBT4306413.1 triose-phosphate isomerase [Chloroflexota bacterium]MBT4534614.1 triose-phosphate isomerase [Chloroflexota bacterium]